MEPKFRTSFIPKAPVVASPTRPRPRGAFGLINAFAVLIFLGVVVLAVGVYLYEQYLEQSIASKDDNLKRARAAFEPALIEELRRLDQRLTSADQLLKNHLAPSAIFAILGENTLTKVRYTDFRLGSGAGGVTIAMRGEAESFEAVALQSDAFAVSKTIRNPIFSNLSLGDRGQVSFDFTATIDPSILLYNPAPSADTSTTTDELEALEIPEVPEEDLTIPEL